MRSHWRALVGLGLVLATTGTAMFVTAATSPRYRRPPVGPTRPANEQPLIGVAPSGAQTGSGAPARQVRLVAGRFVPTRLRIDRLGIDARVEIKRVNRYNVMEVPDWPFEVAWYSFTTRPGGPGNAVFSGHVDSAQTGPAVFWQLATVGPGDVIEVFDAAGSGARYQVAWVRIFSLAAIPMGSVIGPNAADAITVITCAGQYRPGSGYPDRLVVRAVREAGG
jgi:sortase family protein